MKKVRRRFSREFKLEAVRQLTAGRRLADVARELGVEAQVMRRWVQQVAVDPATAFPGNGRARHEEAELQRLRREVTQLRAERDFLKKVAAFFAKEAR
jgi:transposase